MNTILLSEEVSQTAHSIDMVNGSVKVCEENIIITIWFFCCVQIGIGSTF